MILMYFVSKKFHTMLRTLLVSRIDMILIFMKKSLPLLQNLMDTIVNMYEIVLVLLHSSEKSSSKSIEVRSIFLVLAIVHFSIKKDGITLQNVCV